MFKLQQFDKQLHSLKAVVRALKLSVVVERGTYYTVCNNYWIIEHICHSGPNTNKKRTKFQCASVHINICNIKIWLNNTKEKFYYAFYCAQLFIQFHLYYLEHLHYLRLKHVNWLRSWDGLLRFVVDLLKLCSRLKASPWNGPYFLPFPSNSLVIVAIMFDTWYIICIVAASLNQQSNRIVGSLAV